MKETTNDWTLHKLFQQDINAIKAFLIEFLCISLGSIVVWLCAVVTSIAITVIAIDVSDWTDCASAGGCGLAILFALAYINLILAAAWVVLELIINLIWLIARIIKIPLVVISFATLLYFGFIFSYPNYTLPQTRFQFVGAGVIIALLQISLGYIAIRLSQNYLRINSPPKIDSQI